MKYKVVLFLVILTFYACERDFDPQIDSTLCPMTFSFEPLEFFDTIPEGYVMRIRSYCYDSGGKLIRTDTAISQSLSSVELKVPYVFTTQEYRFVFFADFTQDDRSYWFPLSSAGWNFAYMRRSNDQEVPHFAKFVCHGQWNGKPVASTIPITMKQVNYGCKCALRNLSALDKLEVSLGYFDTFYFHDYSVGGTRYWKTSTYYAPMDSIIIPMVLTMADDKLVVRIYTKQFSQRDTLAGSVQNELRRPFVLNVDGSNLDNTIDWYE